MATETNYTEKYLKSIPEKEFKKILREFLTPNEAEGLDKEQLISVILEMQSNNVVKASEEKERAEPDHSLETNVVKPGENQNKAHSGLFPIASLTLEMLETLRPDLFRQLVERGSRAMNSSPENTGGPPEGEYATKGLYNVTLGPVGPMQVEAFTESDALGKFLSRAGINSFSHHKPEIQRIRNVE